MSLLTQSLKRSRTDEGGSLSKRKVPYNYAPSTTCDMIKDQTNDWVSRTEHLALATPPAGGSPPEIAHIELSEAPEREMDMDMAHSVAFSDSTTSFSSSGHTFSVPQTPAHSPRQGGFFPSLHIPPIMPHHAPRLFDRLRGSPPSPPPASIHHQNSHVNDFFSVYENDNGNATAQTERASAPPRVTLGFRTDCQKCHDRVPGHWAHISPSTHSHHHQQHHHHQYSEEPLEERLMRF